MIAAATVAAWVILAAGVALGWPLGYRVARARAATVLADLAARWDDDHDVWCCTLGCQAPDRQHPVAGTALTSLMGNLHRHHIPIRMQPCDGTCNCGAATYVEEVREAMTRL